MVAPSVQNLLQCKRLGFDPWVWKFPWRRKWQPTPVFLPVKSHGQRRLVGYSPKGHKEWDMAEQLRAHTLPHSKSLLTLSEKHI